VLPCDGLADDSFGQLEQSRATPGSGVLGGAPNQPTGTVDQAPATK
jgi:hypothetical protein